MMWVGVSLQQRGVVYENANNVQQKVIKTGLCIHSLNYLFLIEMYIVLRLPNDSFFKKSYF